MDNQKRDEKMNITDGYEVQSSFSDKIVEFRMEAFHPRKAAIDTAIGIAKEFKCCIFVKNTETGFIWTVMPDGDVQAVGASE